MREKHASSHFGDISGTKVRITNSISSSLPNQSMALQDRRQGILKRLGLAHETQVGRVRAIDRRLAVVAVGLPRL